MSDPGSPKERLEARGYVLDEDGITVEIGHDRDGTARDQQAANFNMDPWAWLLAHEGEALKLRCRGRTLGLAWTTPGGIWYRSGHFHGPVEHWVTPQGAVPLVCANHGLTSVTVGWLAEHLRAQHAQAMVSCRDTTRGNMSTT